MPRTYGELAAHTRHHATNLCKPGQTPSPACLSALPDTQAYKTYKLGGKVSELLYSPAAYGIDVSARDAPKPRARSSPMMAVVKNTLWMFGGIVEVRAV